MFCSTIIATIGRPSLSRAVESVLAQRIAHAEHELIVVNDSGEPLLVGDWANDPRVTILSTPQRERCVARNAGAAVAKGRFLNFLDDDDWLLPDGLLGLFELSEEVSAEIYFGGTQLIDRNGRQQLELHPNLDGNVLTQVMAGEWIPLLASLIDSDLFWQVGGFNHAIAGREDIDLLRKVALVGRVTGTPQMVACVGMGAAGSTTPQLRQADALARSGLLHTLQQSGAWRRLWDSADSAYWQGRIARLYLVAAYSSIQQKNIVMTLFCAACAVAALLRSKTALLQRSYWQALTRRHQGVAFQRGIAAQTKRELNKEKIV